MVEVGVGLRPRKESQAGTHFCGINLCHQKFWYSVTMTALNGINPALLPCFAFQLTQL